MATSGPDLLLAAYQALDADERDEAFERLHDLRVAEQVSVDSDMARYLCSLRRVAEVVGRTPTSDDYREVQPRLAAAGEPVESFSRVYRFFGSWPRAREALDLSTTPGNTPRRIEARFRERRLGKVWRYDEDVLRGTVARAAEHFGGPPSTTEFDWWRQREFELARATGRSDPHLPSVTPYRKRWGTWEAALLHFGYSAEDVARRLTAQNNIVTRDWDPDALLPDGLPMAGLASRAPAEVPVGGDALARLRAAYQALPRRSRYVLTVRLGLGTEPLTLTAAARPLGLSHARVRQIQAAAVQELVAAAAGGEALDADFAERQGAVEATLRLLATTGKT